MPPSRLGCKRHSTNTVSLVAGCSSVGVSRVHGRVALPCGSWSCTSRCEFCVAPERVFNLEFEVEHIVPSARGGADDLDNLALACRACNLRKGTAVEARDPLSGELVQLFNPRRDGWAEHFRLHLDGRIEGRTAMGRVTVAQLAMNRRTAMRARRLWLDTRLLG
jgi:hypothetical protein